MKRLNRVISLIIIISTLLMVPVFAAPDSSSSDGWANPDTFSVDSGVNTIGSNSGDGIKDITQGSVIKRMAASKKYYSFTIYETDGLIVKVGVGNVLNGIANTFFAVAKMWMEFVAKMTYWTLNLDLYKLGQNSIDDLISSITKLAGNVYGGKSNLAPIIWLGVAFSFGLVVLMFVRNQTAGALGKIVAIAIVLALISAYATLPKFFMGGMQSTVQNAGKSILSISDGDAKTTAATRIWVMGVDIPWQQLEFGTIHVGAQSGGVFSQKKGNCLQWLGTHPDSREKAFAGSGDIPKGAQANAVNSASIQAQRAGEALFVLLIDIVVGLIFLILAAVALGFQLGSIIMWILGFFVLIISLFPTHSASKIKEWLGLLAMTYFGQMIVYVGILLVLETLGWFYKVSNNDLFIIFGLMVGLGVGLKMMASPIARLFSGTEAMRDAGGGAILNGLGGVRRRISGYKGDSTERLMPSPIRRNREARRQVKKEEKMQQYRNRRDAAQERKAQRNEQRRAAREESVAAAVRDRLRDKAENSAVAVKMSEASQARREEREVFASEIRTQGIRAAVASKYERASAAREARQEAYRERVRESYTPTTAPARQETAQAPARKPATPQTQRAATPQTQRTETSQQRPVTPTTRTAPSTKATPKQPKQQTPAAKKPRGKNGS